jgi:protein-disulfide isomerase
MSDEFTIKLKKESIWKYATFILAAVLVVGIIISLTGNGSSGKPQNQGTAGTQGTQGTQATGPTPKVNVQIGSAPVIGSKSAAVTIVEVSDFSCPYCSMASGDNPQSASFYGTDSAPVPGIMQNYVQTGKAQMALKYFPGHGQGQQAQIVGWCLNDQNPDAFWKYYNKVFAEPAQANNVTEMSALAVGLGADSSKLNSCVSSGKYTQRLTDETNEGTQLGISGTPSFFINGKLIVGACPYSLFDSAIKAEIAGKDWSVNNCQLTTY